VSIRYGLKGPNFATVSACASSAHAIGESYELIKHGQAEAMVMGARKRRNHWKNHRGFRTKALSTGMMRRKASARSTRSGTVSCWATGRRSWYPSLEHAQAPGRILGEVVEFAAQWWLPIISAGRRDSAMPDYLKDGGIDASAVGSINAHGRARPREMPRGRRGEGGVRPAPRLVPRLDEVDDPDTCSAGGILCHQPATGAGQKILHHPRSPVTGVARRRNDGGAGRWMSSQFLRFRRAQ
jgi:hypothetical protein